jgi:hypothetical protein
VCFAIKAWMECPRHGPTCFIVLAADPVHVEHFKCKTPKERQEWLNCFQWSADYRSLERPYVCKFEHFQKEDRPFGRGNSTCLCSKYLVNSKRNKDGLEQFIEVNLEGAELPLNRPLPVLFESLWC